MKEPEIKVEIGEITMDTVVGERTHRVGEDDWEQEPITLGHLVAEIVTERAIQSATKDEYRGLRNRVSEVRNEVIREKVAPLIEEALTGEIRKTNSYGEPTGQTTTLRDEIMAEAQRTLTKPTGSSYDRQKSLLQTIIEKEVSQVLRKELTDVLAEEKKKLINAVRAEGMKMFTDILEKGVRFP